MSIWMKRATVALAAAMVAGPLAAGSPAADLANRAPAAKAAVDALFPRGSILEFGQETEAGVSYFEVLVDTGSGRSEVEVTAEGRIGEVESDVSASDLPAPVREAITAHVGSAPIRSIERHEVHGVPRGGSFEPVAPPRVIYELSYEVDGGRKEIAVDAAGRLLPAEAEDDADDAGHDDDD